MNCFKVEWSYLDGYGKRLYRSDVFFVPYASDAVKKVHHTYPECVGVRIEDVWQDSGYSWDSVDRSLWEE